MSQQTQAVQSSKGPATIRDMVQAYSSQFAKVLPRHLSPDRFVRVALTAITRTPKLAECEQASFFQCLLTLSSLGIEPDGRRAHLIPFENKKRGVVECTLIIDYKGLVELAMRSGMIGSIHTDVVCENDTFTYNRGHIVAHEIDFKKPRGTPYAAYSLVTMKDGSEATCVMGRDEIYAVRDKSSGWRAFKAGYVKQSTWADPQSEPEMWKKTTFRRISKWICLSPEFRDAVETNDEQVKSIESKSVDIQATATVFELAPPVAADDDGNGQEEAPEPKKAEIPPAVKPEAVEVPAEPDAVPVEVKTEMLSPNQKELRDLIVNAGFSFDLFAVWGRESGNLSDTDSIAGFDQIPGGICQRLIKAKVGLLRSLEVLSKKAGGV